MSSVVATVADQVAPAPALKSLCKKLKADIRTGRPSSKDELIKTDPERVARTVGTAVNTNVEQQGSSVQQNYDGLDATPETPPASRTATPITDPASAVERGGGDPGAAAPRPIPSADLSLDADVAANDARMRALHLDSPGAQAVTSGPIAEARSAHADLESLATTGPAEVEGAQQERLEASRLRLAELRSQALVSLRDSRVGAIGGGRRQQDRMVGSERAKRQAFSRRLQRIATTTKTFVDNKLKDLPKLALDAWKLDVEKHAKAFDDALAEVERLKRERYSPRVLGLLRRGVDLVSGGLPFHIVRKYGEAEKAFGDSVCATITRISTDVETVIRACEKRIEDAKKEAEREKEKLGPDLQAWATQEMAGFEQRLAQLGTRVRRTRDSINQQLAREAVDAVLDVRQRVQQLREAAKGFLRRAAERLGEILDDPLKAIVDGLLRLVGIEPAAFWTVVARIKSVVLQIARDPLPFARNLALALKNGFQRFFGKIKAHLLSGLLDWLFSGLGRMGITLPSDFSLKSVITFFLEVMGISWARIRLILERHIGARNVALIEKAWQMVSLMIEKGPVGIFEMIKDRLDPRALLRTVLDAAIDYVVDTLITRVTVQIVAMFNPAGAIAKALQVVYQIVKWVFQNAARIFSLVETVVNGVWDLLNGNTERMAAAVESSLARMIAPVIDFLAGLVGLGDLPEKVAGVVRGLQSRVERVIDRVVGWLVERARALLERVRGNGAEEEESDLPTARFTTDEGEQHTLELQQQGDRVQTIMRSDPEPLTAVLSHEVKDPSDVDRARSLQNSIETLARRDPNREESRALESMLNRLAELLKSILGDLPLSPEPVFNGPRSVIAAALYEREPGELFQRGDIPRAQLQAGRDILDDEHGKGGWGSYWPRLHLLSRRLGGPGTANNLIFGSEQSNRAMEQIELPAIATTRIKPIWYEVRTVPHAQSELFLDSLIMAYGEAIHMGGGQWSKGAQISSRMVRSPPPEDYPTPRDGGNLHLSTAPIRLVDAALSSIRVRIVRRADVLGYLRWRTPRSLSELSVDVERDLAETRPLPGDTELSKDHGLRLDGEDKVRDGPREKARATKAAMSTLRLIDGQEVKFGGIAYTLKI